MSKKNKKDFIIRIPRTVHGGIRAQVKRSQARRKPWAKQWINYIESLSMGARLGRGRAYAISGQVFDLEIGAGIVRGKVQGASSKPYICTFECETVSDKEKKEIVENLRKRPMAIAQLLVHNLPESIQLIFRSAGYPLLPTLENPLLPQCSCPDETCHCKHIAALLFILGEAVEQNPMLLLQMRGITIEDILGEETTQATQKKSIPRQAKSRDLISFWGDELETEFDYGPSPEKETAHAPLSNRLGAFPFWRGEERFLETITQCGERASAAGLNLWSGEAPKRILNTQRGTPIGEIFGGGKIW